MTNCPSCKYSVSSDALKCPNCGISFDETSGATAFMPPEKEQPKPRSGESSSIHSTESADGARFAAGTILAERYRIINLLGRGGMGEVYKAEDLKLKQIVALKFLPELLATNTRSLDNSFIRRIVCDRYGCYMLRFGLLSLTVAAFVSTLPLTNNFSPWFTSYMIGMFVFVLVGVPHVAGRRETFFGKFARRLTPGSICP